MEKENIILHTERLLLREFNVSDAASFYLLNSDWDVMQFTGDVAFDSIAHSAEFIQAYDAYEKQGFGRWTTILKDTKEVIGWCGLKKHPDGMVDLGYRFHKKYWNQGYATEASSASIEYGFNQLNIKTIVGRTAKANLASIKVLEKVGMTFWKESPCEGINDSVYYHIHQQ